MWNYYSRCNVCSSLKGITWKWLKRLVQASKSKTHISQLRPNTAHEKKNIKKGTSKKGEGKKKQLKNKVGGKFQLQLAPFQRQPTASHAWITSLPRQPGSSSRQLQPQLMLACSGQGDDWRLPLWPPLGWIHSPSSALLESGWSSLPETSGWAANASRPASSAAVFSSGAGPNSTHPPSLPRKPAPCTRAGGMECQTDD